MSRGGFYNQEGYPDPTAYEGIRRIMAEDAESVQRVNALIKELKALIRESGFELIARIELRDRRSGREYG